MRAEPREEIAALAVLRLRDRFAQFPEAVALFERGGDDRVGDDALLERRLEHGREGRVEPVRDL